MILHILYMHGNVIIILRSQFIYWDYNTPMKSSCINYDVRTYSRTCLTSLNSSWRSYTSKSRVIPIIVHMFIRKY